MPALFTSSRCDGTSTRGGLAPGRDVSAACDRTLDVHAARA